MNQRRRLPNRRANEFHARVLSVLLGLPFARFEALDRIAEHRLAASAEFGDAWFVFDCFRHRLEILLSAGR